MHNVSAGLIWPMIAGIMNGTERHRLARKNDDRDNRIFALTQG